MVVEQEIRAPRKGTGAGPVPDLPILKAILAASLPFQAVCDRGEVVSSLSPVPSDWKQPRVTRWEEMVTLVIQASALGYHCSLEIPEGAPFPDTHVALCLLTSNKACLLLSPQVSCARCGPSWAHFMRS